MTDAQTIMLGFLSRHCRGPAAARKAWKIAEDLSALGLDAGPQAILDALADLRGEGFAVTSTGGDLPALYIEERRRRRGREDWRAGRRTRGTARPVRPSAEARALAEAEAAYQRLVDAAPCTTAPPGRPRKGRSGPHVAPRPEGGLRAPPRAMPGRPVGQRGMR